MYICIYVHVELIMEKSKFAYIKDCHLHLLTDYYN